MWWESGWPDVHFAESCLFLRLDARCSGSKHLDPPASLRDHKDFLRLSSSFVHHLLYVILNYGDEQCAR